MATASRSPATVTASGVPQRKRDGSALLLDFAGNRTNSALIDLVDAGQHRFVSSSLRVHLSGDSDDMVFRLRDAIAAIEARSARRLLESNRLIAPERKDGSGCDAAVLTASLPMSVAIIGDAASPLRKRLDAVLATTIAIRTAGLDVAAGRRSDQSLLAKLVACLGERPDLLIVLPEPEQRRGQPVVGLGQHLSIALEHAVDDRPIVLGLGNKSQTDAIGGLVSRFADFRSVDLGVADGAERLRTELMAIWRDTLDRRYAGYGYIQSWLLTPPVPTADGFAVALRYLATRRRGDVWGIDLGAETTTIIRASSEQVWLGISKCGWANAAMWLQSPVSSSSPATDSGERQRDCLWNQHARPAVRPTSGDEQNIIRAVAGEAVARTLQSAHLPRSAGKGADLLVLRGEIAQIVAYSADAIAALAREVRPAGIFEVALDRHGILPGLGALASAEPLVAAEVLLADGLRTLGTVAVGSGRTGTASASATVEVRSRSGAQQSVAAIDVPTTLLVPAGETADLTINPAKGFDFGRGAGQAVTAQAPGGDLGIVLFASSKPATRASRG